MRYFNVLLLLMNNVDGSKIQDASATLLTKLFKDISRKGNAKKKICNYAQRLHNVFFANLPVSRQVLRYTLRSLREKSVYY